MGFNALIETDGAISIISIHVHPIKKSLNVHIPLKDYFLTFIRGKENSVVCCSVVKMSGKVGLIEMTDSSVVTTLIGASVVMIPGIVGRHDDDSCIC